MWTLKIILLVVAIKFGVAIELSCQRHPELEHIECQLSARVDDDDVPEITSYKSQTGESFDQITDLVLVYKNLPLHMPHGIGKVFVNLLSFDLSSSNVKFFDKTCFERMESLIFLRLSHNEIEELPVDIFNNLPRLEHVDLSRNKISKLSKETFQKNLNLKYLKLSENKIEELKVGTFESNLKLRKIFLGGNKLKRVGVDFSVLRGLTFLDLIGNDGNCNFRFDKKEMKKFDLNEIARIVVGGCSRED